MTHLLEVYVLISIYLVLLIADRGNDDRLVVLVHFDQCFCLFHFVDQGDRTDIWLEIEHIMVRCTCRRRTKDLTKVDSLIDSLADRPLIMVVLRYQWPCLVLSIPRLLNCLLDICLCAKPIPKYVV